MKLSAYGIQGRVATWLSEFLGGRLQRVVLNQAASGWASITSGISQGSVLRPLLFLLYVNDIPDLVLNNFKMFTDDFKIYRAISFTAYLTVYYYSKIFTSCLSGYKVVPKV